MPAADAHLLREVYKAYRSAAHRQALQNEAGTVTRDVQFADERRQVMRTWQGTRLS